MRGDELNGVAQRTRLKIEHTSIWKQGQDRSRDVGTREGCTIGARCNIATLNGVVECGGVRQARWHRDADHVPSLIAHIGACGRGANGDQLNIGGGRVSEGEGAVTGDDASGYIGQSYRVAVHRNDFVAHGDVGASDIVAHHHTVTSQGRRTGEGIDRHGLGKTQGG